MPSYTLNLFCNEPRIAEQYRSWKPAHEGDVGFNLLFTSNVTVPAKAISFEIKLGVFCDLRADTAQSSQSPVQSFPQISARSSAFFVYPRSSMGKNTPLRLCNSVGIIDAGYRGEIAVYVDNVSDAAIHLFAGKSLFQICTPELSQQLTCNVVDSLEILAPTTRGEAGFGSTDASLTSRPIYEEVPEGTLSLKVA